MKNTTHQIETYFQRPFTIVKGQGSYVWDDTGKKYLDYYCGHVVCGLGHCPPTVVEAIKTQTETLMFYSNIFATKPNQEYAKLITSTLNPHIYQAYFANSGSESNETALKIARKHTGKSHIIAFDQSWHGRAISTMSVSGFPKYRKFKPDLEQYTSFVEHGNLAEVKAAFTPDTAAIICEPIQSIGGINMAEKEFYQELFAFAQKNNILLIMDEVQTGMGRTGTFWFSQYLEITPHIITTAKSIASGLPMSMNLIREDIADKIERGDQATTFGGGPVVCAAAIATYHEIQKNLPSINERSDYLRTQLLTIPWITAVKGKGFLIGLEVIAGYEDLVDQCLAIGLIMGGSSKKNTFRLMPPLNTTQEEMDECVEKLKSI